MSEVGLLEERDEINTQESGESVGKPLSDGAASPAMPVQAGCRDGRAAKIYDQNFWSRGGVRIVQRQPRTHARTHAPPAKTRAGSLCHALDEAGTLCV